MDFSVIARDGLVLLGCGRMGSALLQGWLAGGLPPAAVHVIEPQPAAWLQASGVALNAVLPPAPAVAVIAVKPQTMRDALPQLQPMGGGGTLFVSIAAGVRIAGYEELLGPATPIVRAMPNTPAAVGRGISAIIGNQATGAADLDLAAGLLASVGEVVRLADEGQMDAVTALSGSGPAYVFHLIETMAAAGTAQGLAPDIAMQLARATVIGAGELARQSPDSAADLRIAVTSPGGTTAAALAVLMDPAAGLGALMDQAIVAATARGRELGG